MKNSEIKTLSQITLDDQVIKEHVPSWCCFTKGIIEIEGIYLTKSEDGYIVKTPEREGLIISTLEELYTTMRVVRQCTKCVSFKPNSENSSDIGSCLNITNKGRDIIPSKDAVCEYFLRLME